MLWFNNWGISIFSLIIFDVKFNLFCISIERFLFPYILFWFNALLFIKVLFSIIGNVEDDELFDFFIEETLSKERSLSELITSSLLLFVNLIFSSEMSCFCCWLSFNKIKEKII